MRNRLGFTLLAAAALTGCPTTTPPVDGNVIMLVDGNMNDAFRTDTNMPMTDTGIDPGNCSGTGHIGAHCRTGGTAQCVNGSTCFDFGATMTIQEVFGIPSGTLMDPAHPDYQLIDTSATAETADFNGAEGSLCAQQCNTAVDDMCGTCTTCSTAITQMPLMQAFGGILTVIGTANRMFGNDTGICRLDCTYDRATRGDECPDDSFTCDQFGGVCVEACTSDNECNTAYGVTYQGELVTLVNHDHADVCNMATGRCEFPAAMASATAHVGDHCDSNADCPSTGICLNGGHCAEFGCTNPGTSTSVCGGPSNNLGICLTANATAHSTTLCLTGCNTAADCGAGNICNALTDASGAVFTIAGGGASYTGYCIGVCETDDQCLAAESCTDFNNVDTTGAVVANNGRCVPRCTGVGMEGTASGCAADEWCSPDASQSNGVACTAGGSECHAPYTMCLFGQCRSAAPTFGQCSPLGAFCGDSNTNHLAAAQGDCATTQVCDETLATPHDATTHAVDRESFGDGHCVPRCTMDADCTGAGHPAGAVCVPTGPYAGLCRVPCTGAGGDAGTADAGTAVCPVDQSCDGTEHFCAEVAPPAAP